MQLPLVEKAEEIHFISRSASEENQLQQQVDSVKALWVHRKLTMRLVRENDPGSCVVANMEELMTDLDDSLATLTVVLSSR